MAVKFDLSSIPQDAVITKATLSLYAYDKNTGTQYLNNGPKKLYQFSSSWTEDGLKWSGSPQIANTALASSSNSSIDVWEDFDVTEYVKGVIENEDSNYGFQVKHSSSSYGVKYRSSEFSEQEFRPKLAISFDPMTGINQNITKINPNKIYTVTVTNMQGREIASFKSNDIDKISLQKRLPSGIHIVHIMTSDKKMQLVKFSTIR